MPNTEQTSQQKPTLSMSLNKLVLLVCLLFCCYFGYARYASHMAEQTEASSFILSPKLNDIYFLDVTLLDNFVASKNKYKLAKVVRVNNDNVAIVYGKFLYQWQSAVVKSIEYGDLNNNNYFALIPEFISFTKIQEMRGTGAIYLVKRPIRNEVYGGPISL